MNIPLDPQDPATRLLRAINGQCPDCDRTDNHIHKEHPNVAQK